MFEDQVLLTNYLKNYVIHVFLKYFKRTWLGTNSLKNALPKFKILIMTVYCKRYAVCLIFSFFVQNLETSWIVKKKVILKDFIISQNAYKMNLILQSI